VEARIDVPPRLAAPLGVRVDALASSEVFWNGRLIGRNGRPAARAADEIPGRVEAVFVVPEEAVTPGANRLTVILSSHHGLLRFRTTVLRIVVGRCCGLGKSLGDYAAALAALGVLAVGVAYFGTLWWLHRADRASLLLAAAAAAAAGQLAAEVARGFTAYPYPLHAVRVGLIAGFAAMFGLLLVAFCAVRFTPGRGRGVLLAAASATAAGLVLLPVFDDKALAGLVIGSSAAAWLAWRGWRARQAGAGPALAGLLLFPVLAVLSGRAFLDQAFYLALVGLACLLFASQGLALRREQRDREAAKLQAAELELESLKQRMRRLVVHQRGRREVIDLGEVLAIRGADDYAELLLADGRKRLLNESLASLAERLPDDFLRVHRSGIVNLRRVREVARRPGGGQEVLLDSGVGVPVGRTYARALAAAMT
jgi:DNA-binding LytR/AlgR family response regulator